MHVTIHPILRLFARYPVLGGVFGLVIAVAFGFLGVSSWFDLQKMPDQPVAMTLEQAVSATGNTEEDIWVSLEKVNWDCRNVVYSDLGDNSMRTEVIFTNDDRSIFGVALFSDSKRMNCEDLSDVNVTGTLSRMGDGFYERMPARGFDLDNYRNVTTRLNLCNFCGRGNSSLGVLCGAVMVPLGLLMYPLCLAMKRNYEKKGLM
jgi:hypothetical protein